MCLIWASKFVIRTQYEIDLMLNIDMNFPNYTIENPLKTEHFDQQ